MNQYFEQITNKIKNNNKIYIMTHRNMDLDGFGAALGMVNIIKKYKKNAQIVINTDEQEVSIKKAIAFLEKNKMYKFIESKNIDDNIEVDLLFILDVHKREMVESSLLVDKSKDIILLDHHVNRMESIPSFINYIKPTSSSTVEIMIDYLKDEKINIDSITATIMLAGIYIDTNAFNIKTNANTFEAAAYLMNNKADNVKKQELFQEDLKDILKRQRLLKHSYKINEHIMICVLDKSIYKTSDLAKISEELLQIQDSEVSFTIGYIAENVVGISARSIGKIDVEKIMKKMGGGGHKTDAATKIDGKTIEDVKVELEQILR